MSSRMKEMLVNLPLVNVMKWAISGAVFTIRMPPSSCILRLEDDEDNAGNRYHDKRFVDHAGSYLIAVAGAYEVDGTDDGEQDNETQVQNLMVGNL